MYCFHLLYDIMNVVFDSFTILEDTSLDGTPVTFFDE
jgi:hypothetical protein